MCGRLNVIDDPFVMALLKSLNVRFNQPLRTGQFIRPTNTISIVREHNNARILDDAIWWLLLEQNNYHEWKPSKYASFNTRSDKLLQPGSAGYNAFHKQRCLIVASGFGETMTDNSTGMHNNKRYFNFYPLNESLVFAGLYRQWRNELTGQLLFSASIITKAPHPKIAPFHQKASPFILNQADDSINLWLNPNTEINTLLPLLVPSIPQDLVVVEIEQPSKLQPISPAQLLIKDQQFA